MSADDRSTSKAPHLFLISTAHALPSLETQLDDWLDDAELNDGELLGPDDVLMLCAETSLALLHYAALLGITEPN